jgi:hypothetical protein
MDDMTEITPNDRTGKLLDFATKSIHFIVDEIGDALDQVRSKVRAEHEAVEEIADLLTSPPFEDPLAVIREIEDRIGVDHYDWPKYGQWIGHSSEGD